MVRFWSAEHFRERLAFLLERMFLSPRRVAWLYAVSPLSLRVLRYYLQRLRTLIGRYGRVMWKWCRHDANIVDGVSQQTTLIQWLLSQPSPQKQEKHQGGVSTDISHLKT